MILHDYQGNGQVLVWQNNQGVYPFQIHDNQIWNSQWGELMRQFVRTQLHASGRTVWRPK